MITLNTKVHKGGKEDRQPGNCQPLGEGRRGGGGKKTGP